MYKKNIVPLSSEITVRNHDLMIFELSTQKLFKSTEIICNYEKK